MADDPQTKHHVARFSANRADAKDVFSLRLVRDAEEVRRLDRHLDDFLARLRQDAKEHKVDDLKAHAKSFEKELHEELGLLFKRTKADLELYQRLLKGLSSYRQELKDLTDDKKVAVLAKTELAYADLLVRTAQEKLATLSVLFRKLKG